MTLIGEKVTHKKWMNGTIIACDNEHVTVHFDRMNADKVFVYPDIFGKFIKLANDSLQAEVQVLIDEKNQRIQAEKEKQDAERLQAQQERMTLLEGNSKGTKMKKLPPRKNLAFKLNYCDGGASMDTVGYQGVCSDDIIRYNIETVNRSWCSYNGCPCKQYLDGEITREELEQLHKKKPVCYESEALVNWSAQAGTDLKGENEGKARRIPNAQLGSLAILTTRFPNEPEDERIIVGAFIVDSAMEGDDMTEGAVACHSKYHVEIKPNEVRKLKFWNYYQNEGNPDLIRWGTGLYRFVKDDDSLQLLKDIVEVKKGTPGEGIAKDILDYYQKLHTVE